MEPRATLPPGERQMSGPERAAIFNKPAGSRVSRCRTARGSAVAKFAPVGALAQVTRIVFADCMTQALFNAGLNDIHH